MARPVRSGRRADYAWNGGTFAFDGPAEANLISSLGTFGESLTIRRLRGEVLCTIDGTADGDKKVVGIGIILATDAAVAAGATALPSPVIALDADWIWHGFFPMASQTGSSSPDLGAHNARLTIDSKAMRRVRSNQQLVVVVDGLNLSGTPVMDLVGAVRFLFSEN